MLAKDLKLAMQQEADKHLLVDVREAEEIAASPFFAADSAHYANIPLTVLAASPKEEIIARLEAAASRLGLVLPDVKIAVACRSGSRSSFAAERLSSFGIAAENMEDGRISWGEPL